MPFWFGLRSSFQYEQGNLPRFENSQAQHHRHATQLILSFHAATWRVKVAITERMMSAHPPACDRCHALKMKCVYQDIHSRLACSHCWRMAHPCTTTRKSLTVGRPRKMTTTTQPQPSTEFVWAYSQQRATTTTSVPTGAHSKSLRPTQERATPFTLRPRNVLLSSLKSSERLLLEFIFHTPTFIHYFILAPSFADSILTQLFARVCSCPEVLRDIFLANAGQFARLIGLQLTNNDSNDDFSNGAKAVQVLRAAEMQVLQQETELIKFLTLGLGIITFDLFTSGLHIHSVSRFTINLVKHLYPQARSDTQEQRLVSRPHLDLHSIPLLFCDTINCIVKREVPVLKFQCQTPQPVDRYIGICTALLPHLFDICHASHELNTSTIPEKYSSGTLKVDIKKELGTIEQAIESLVLLAPDDFIASHATHDVKIIETQAQIYKYAALLVVRRLRFQLSTQDNAARNLSHLIFTNIKKLQGFAQSAKDNYNQVDSISSYRQFDVTFEYRLSFPYFVASLEVEDPEERIAVMNILCMVVSPKKYPYINHMLERFLHYYWRAHDENPNRQWFDIVSHGPPFVLY